jgi:hypothetical protein
MKQKRLVFKRWNKWNFLYENYICLQNPWKGGLPPPDPYRLSSTEFVWLPAYKIPRNATGGSSVDTHSETLDQRFNKCLLRIWRRGIYLIRGS